MENGVVIQWDTGFGFTGGWVGPIFGTGGQTNEVFNGLRRVVAEQFDDDVAAVGFDDSFMCSNTIDAILPSLTALTQS